jgi:ribosomal protein S12 methylthiotransferase accessory factor
MANAFDDGRGPLARLGKLFDVIDLPAPDVPACFSIALPSDTLLDMPLAPRAAMPETGRMASGRGWSVADCHASCLGEAAELFSCCEWGNEFLVTATAAEIGPAAITPDALNGFGRSQLLQRAVWNGGNAGFDWRPPPHDPTVPLDWLAVEDAFGGDQAFAPADFAFIGRRPAGDENAVSIGDSNGCAAGSDAEAAKLAAVLELVERDATGRWWYGRRQRRTIDPTTIAGIGGLAGWLSGRARRSWLFDIGSDIAIPAIAAVSAEPDGRDVALGFAARLDEQAAATAALTEMLQMEISLAASLALGDAAGTWSRWRNDVSMRTAPLSAALAQSAGQLQPPRAPGAGADLPRAIEALARAGIDLWFADMTRPEIGVPVFRALSAKLCHYKPRFGRERLLAPDAHDLRRVRGRAETQTPLLI